MTGPSTNGRLILDAFRAQEAKCTQLNNGGQGGIPFYGGSFQEMIQQGFTLSGHDRLELGT